MDGGTLWGFHEHSNVCTIDFVYSQNWFRLLESWHSFSSEKKKYILKNYLFIFTLEEGIEPHYTLRVMEWLVRVGCRVHSNAFISQSLELYFNSKYPNHRFTSSNLKENLHIGCRGGLASNLLEFNYKKSLSTDRKYRVKYFSWRHTPARDDAWLWLRDLGWLKEDNNIFVRRKRDNQADKLGYQMYKQYNKLRIPFDDKWLNDTSFIHEDELDRNVVDNQIQDDGLYQAHLNSYFDILTETLHPFENHPLEIVRNQTSFSKRTFFPLVCRNVFHIYPTNKPLERLLKHLGFEIFFENHEEFVNNATPEYYKREDVQKKLDKNQFIIMGYLHRNWWL